MAFHDRTPGRYQAQNGKMLMILSHRREQVFNARVPLWRVTSSSSSKAMSVPGQPFPVLAQALFPRRDEEDFIKLSLAARRCERPHSVAPGPT